MRITNLILDTNIERVGDHAGRLRLEITGSLRSNIPLQIGSKIKELDLTVHGLKIAAYNNTADTYLFVADHFVDTSDLQILEESEDVVREPTAGDLWTHHNGNEYVVVEIANDHSDRPEYPRTVIYRGRNGRTWAKTESNFLEKMQFVRELKYREFLNFCGSMSERY